MLAHQDFMDFEDLDENRQRLFSKQDQYGVLNNGLKSSLPSKSSTVVLAIRGSNAVVLTTNCSSAATGRYSFKSRNLFGNDIRFYHVNGTLKAAKLSVTSRTASTRADAHTVCRRSGAASSSSIVNNGSTGLSAHQRKSTKAKSSLVRW